MGDISRKEKAMQLFTEGYNCSQSVVLAFADMLPEDEKTLAMMSSSFGGGLGRMREVCGAVSGMAIVIGFLCGSYDPADHEAKSAHYARVQALARSFEEANGSIVCRELLGISSQHDAPVSPARDAAFYKKRPCKELVGMAAEILDNYLTEESL